MNYNLSLWIVKCNLKAHKDFLHANKGRRKQVYWLFFAWFFREGVVLVVTLRDRPLGRSGGSGGFRNLRRRPPAGVAPVQGALVHGRLVVLLVVQRGGGPESQCRVLERVGRRVAACARVARMTHPRSTYCTRNTYPRGPSAVRVHYFCDNVLVRVCSVLISCVWTRGYLSLFMNNSYNVWKEKVSEMGNARTERKLRKSSCKLKLAMNRKYFIVI